MLKNKFITILIALALICPIGLQSSSIYAEPIEQTETTEISDSVQQDSVDEETAIAEPVQNEDAVVKDDNFKQPISKKKIAKKFLLAMFGVAVSSFLIYFVLTLYNKIRYKLVNEVKTPDGETPLKTPDNINEAVQIFLEKTNWK